MSIWGINQSKKYTDKKVSDTNDRLKDAEKLASDAKEMVDGIIDGEFDKASLRVNIEEKLEQLEEEYAPQLNEAKNNFRRGMDRVGEVKNVANRELISRRSRTPMITIVDDDCRNDFLEKWEPILQEKDFKLSAAAITDYIGKPNYMTWDDLERLNNIYDVDFVNHTHTHPNLTEISEQQVRDDFKNSTSMLRERGFSHDVLVYPYGSNNEVVRRIAREFFRTAINISGGVNTPPLETFRLYRLSLIPPDGEMEPLEYYTSIIDEAINNNGWIIWMSHSQYAPFDGSKIKSIIDYANNNGVEWVHVNEGLDKIGNIVDIGDYTAALQGAEYTVLDSDGIIHSRANSKDFYFHPSTSLNITVESPIENWKPRTVNIREITSARSQGFPENKAGVLETTRGSHDNFSHQIYKVYNTNQMYKRTWNTSESKWNEFERVDSIRIKERIRETIEGEVSANESLDVTIDVDGITNRDNIVGSPQSGLEAGLIYSVFIPTVNKVRVRLYNITDNKITTSRPWKFDVIKE